MRFVLVGYRTFNGVPGAWRLADDLVRQGNTLVRIESGEVPFSEGVYLPGHRVIVDDGRPPYRSLITGQMVYDLL